MNGWLAFSWLNAPAWLPLIHALLHTLWQGALAAGALFSVLRFVPTSRVRLRYGLSAAALALVVLAGVGTWALLDAPRPSSVGAGRGNHPSGSAAEHGLNGSPVASSMMIPTPAGKSFAAPMANASPVVIRPVAADGSERWVRWAAAVWLAGMSASLLRAAKGVLGAGRLRRRCRELVDPRVVALAERLRARLGVSRRVRFLVCDEIGMPSMLGVLYPAVLLPASMMTGVPLEQLRAILAHELAHIRRWDYLVNLAQMLVEALLFFNPFVWWLSRQMRLEREACCDQIAVAECGSPACYVEALVAVLRREHLAVALPVLAAGGPEARGSDALERVRRLLVPGYQPAFRLRWFSLSAVLVISGLALGGLWWGTRAVARTVQAPEVKTKSAPPDTPPSPPTPESFVATVSTADGAPADDDSATAYIYESPGPNSGGTSAIGINQPGLIVNHQKGRFMIRPKADSRTLACAVTMQGYAVAFAGPFAPPFKELENIRFTLREGYAASIETVDEAGQPVVGASLSGYYAGPPQVDFGELKTDAAGRATLTHLGEAPLNVRVRADGFQAAEIKNVRLGPAKPYRWTLKKARPLPGIVVAAATGKPIAGATLRLAGVRGAMEETHGGPDGAPLLATSDAQGRFALSSLRPDCRYCLFVEAPGYSGVYVRQLEPSQGELQVSLGPERTVRGRLVHIPDSAFFLDGVPLFYGQTFTFDDNEDFYGQRTLWLHPKDGEADFSIGPFFVTQRGARPADTPAAEGPVTMHLEGRRDIRFAVGDLPKSGYIYDLAEEPGAFSRSAAHTDTDPAPASSPGQPQDLANLEPRQRDVLWTEVNAAIKAGDIGTIDGFLRRGLDVNTDLVGSSSLLFIAADDNQPAIVKLLLARGGDFQQKTSWNDTPLQRACWRGYKEVADILIAAGAPKDELTYATGMGDVPALEARDRRQPITPQEARSKVYFAVASGHPNTFDFLWKKLAPMEETEKGKLLGELYENAGKWNHPNMLPVLEALGASPAKDGSRALLQAAIWDFPDTVKALLERGVPPEPPDQRELLRDVAGDGQLEVVRLLLDHGANINAQDHQGYTPLSWAAYCGKEDVCLLLLERGADGRIKDHDGRNAAWHAAAGPHCAEALARMIQAGVPVDGKDREGATILEHMTHFATPQSWKGAFFMKVYSPADMARFNESERRVIELLLAAGLDPNGPEGGPVPLVEAMQSQHWVTAQALLDHGADASLRDKNGNVALYVLLSYVLNEDEFPLTLFKTLVARTGDLNREITIPNVKPPMTTTFLETLLEVTARPVRAIAARQEAVGILLDAGAKFPGVSDAKVQALLQAAARGDLLRIEDSVRQNAPISAVDSKGWDALSITTALHFTVCADWLIDQGADVNGHHQRPWDCPLNFAIQNGQADLAEKLLAKGSGIERVYGGLYAAVQQKNPRLFDVLLKAGADPKERSNVTVSSGGKTCTPRSSLTLYLCIEEGQTDMARTLLDKGADADPPNLEDGRNLAYWAVNYERPEILRALLDHGADPLVKDDKGVSALDLARKSHPKLVPMLEEAARRKAASATLPFSKPYGASAGRKYIEMRSMPTRIVHNCTINV